MGHHVTVHCPAKVNLGLEVLNRRADGYHDICTVMHAIDLYDELTIEIVDGDGSETPDIDVSGPFFADVPTTGNTLLAAWAVAGGNKLPKLKVSLVKNIPAGAGLGGGSSNGAGMLLALRETAFLAADAWQDETGHEVGQPPVAVKDSEVARNLYSTLNPDRHGGLSHPPSDHLVKLAARIGSDAPFFLGPSCQRAEGRGERLTPIDRKLNFYLLIAVPHFGSATGSAYAALNRPSVPVAPLVVPQLARALASGDLDLLKASIVNDFEPLLRQRRPQYSEWFESLSAAGAFAVALTGSGSGFFGLFTERDAAESALARLEKASLRYCAIHGPLSL